MNKLFGRLLLVVAVLSISSLVSSKASAERPVKESTHFLSLSGLGTSVTFEKMTAIHDCQIIEIPQREIAYPETVGVLKSVEPSKVLPVANSPPNRNI